MENPGGELSDAGYWSCDHGNGSPAPSPPIAELDKSAPLVDEGLDMELDQMLFNEPTPRKRKVHCKPYLHIIHEVLVFMKYVDNLSYMCFSPCRTR